MATSCVKVRRYIFSRITKKLRNAQRGPKSLARSQTLTGTVPIKGTVPKGDGMETNGAILSNHVRTRPWGGGRNRFGRTLYLLVGPGKVIYQVAFQ